MMITLRSIYSPEVQVPSGLLLLRQLKDGFHHQGADASYHAFDEHGQDEKKRAPMKMISRNLNSGIWLCVKEVQLHSAGLRDQYVNIEFYRKRNIFITKNFQLCQMFAKEVKTFVLLLFRQKSEVDYQVGRGLVLQSLTPRLDLCVDPETLLTLLPCRICRMNLH